MLAIESLAKRYSKKEDYVLKDINLEVKQGEFVVILGTSGAGKSTLIRCINRLIEPNSGQLYWYEKNIRKLKKNDLRRYRRDVGMIFQEYNLIERLSVLTNVLVGRFGYLNYLKILLQNYSEGEIKLAQEALARVGLAGYETAKVRDLSGGQRQRVGIARALTQEPRLILGDEPVSSLDPVTAEKIMSLLTEINQKQKITMLISIHNVELAKSFANRIIGIKHGKIVYNDSPDNLNKKMLERIYS
ncbi:phosphonate ABC transporter ATP-binding protein [Natroniella sulfidigena]|uniref:phosphonate ABC transporter ATP-binding protein n=1 Tax=Natroniella sulfidigena TaxID=723921 RepID=UPI00200AC657|nr:phosphonate ABC transporter ATP-binding protein [Natroniella sulfidigena]MCK8816106.1 phosphonate ABC transporter ATP-binding protein [Natroniella sulfidigena]